MKQLKKHVDLSGYKPNDTKADQDGLKSSSCKIRWAEVFLRIKALLWTLSPTYRLEWMNAIPFIFGIRQMFSFLMHLICEFIQLVPDESLLDFSQVQLELDWESRKPLSGAMNLNALRPQSTLKCWHTGQWRFYLPLRQGALIEQTTPRIMLSIEPLNKALLKVPDDEWNIMDFELKI